MYNKEKNVVKHLLLEFDKVIAKIEAEIQREISRKTIQADLERNIIT